MTRATEFMAGISFIIALLAIIYSFVLFNMNIVDWGIFLLVIGFVTMLFLGIVFLRTKD
ncbi:MAG: hypothetical protein WC254_04355 [Candidatus Woesearchaeota archaeon]|jgi:hypothetical protein